MKRRAATTTRPASNLRQQFGRQHHFRPRFEPLEDRRMLSIGATPTDYMPMFVETATESPLVVSTLLDENDGDYSAGDLSLREALVLAADEASYPGADEITFDASLFTDGPATISLDETELTIDSNVTIIGPGADRLTIDANGSSRVLNVDDGEYSNSCNVTLSGLTIAGGSVDDDYGGGICNAETLAVENSTIKGNSAGFGGGIGNRFPAVLTVSNSTISGNLARECGGGVYSSGSAVNVVNCVITQNSSYDGGGVYTDYYGTLMVANSTVSGNFAEHDGGGIFGYSNALTVTNSIVSLNRVSTSWNPNLSGSLTAESGFNLIDTCPGFISPVTPGFDGVWGSDDDMAGDFRLSPESLALDAGSNALAIGADGNPLNTDIQGSPRVQNGVVDIGAFEGVTQPPDGTAYLVTSLADNIEVDGMVTLREAITAANTNTAVGDAPPGVLGGTDAIAFDPTLYAPKPASIFLDGSELVVVDRLAIQGPGADQLTIDAGGTSRIFLIDSGTTAEVSGLTITGGYGEGGGIRNRGNLKVTNCAITCNSGNGAYLDGAGLLNDSGILTVTGSTISKNVADYGAGVINNNGTLTVINSEVWGNTGSGIYNYCGALAVTNSTISANDRYGLYLHDYEGGSAEAVLNNTIAALNSNGDILGHFSGSNNLIGVDPGFVRIPSEGADEKWGTDDDDVGDLRLTATSAAVNAGNALLAVDDAGWPLAVDLRGSTRVIENAVDIGAYEYQGVQADERETPALLVTTADDVFDLYDGDISLREAVYYSHLGAGSGTITFDVALSGRTIALDGHALFICDSVVIDASALSALTVDANGRSGVFLINGGLETGPIDVRLLGLTITGADATSLFASIRNDSDHLTLTDCIVSDNPGVGISNSGTLVVTDSTISNNSNGGIRNRSGQLTVANTTISGNSCSNGGAIDNNWGTVVISDSMITENSAGDGGGIYSNYGTVSVSGTTIAGNTAYQGGGIYCELSPLTISNSQISDNFADRSGGGILAGGTLDISGSTISRNLTEGSNSAGIVCSATTIITDSTIVDNGGGGIYDSGTLTIASSTVSHNFRDGIVCGPDAADIMDCTIAGNGGSGIANSTGTLTVANTSIWGNGRCYSGGGIHNYAGVATVNNSTIWGNVATRGGGVSNVSGTLEIANSTICANSAYSGGGLYADGDSSTATLNNTIVANNTAVSIGADFDFLAGTLLGSNNLIGDGKYQRGLFDGVNGNIVGTTESPVDPLLSDFTQLDNGQWGYCPLPGSPVLDAGSNALAVDVHGQTLEQDVAGYTRIQNETVDIGAIEGATASGVAQTYLVTSLANTTDPGDGELTFVEAFLAANSNQVVGDAPAGSFDDKDVIRFSTDLIGTVYLDQGTLDVFGDLSIEGPGAGLLTFDAQSQSRVVTIRPTVDVTLAGVTITGGYAEKEGGGIGNFGTLGLAGVIVAANSVEGWGGGIFNYGELNVNSCEVLGNSAKGGGGGIDNAGGVLTVANSAICANETSSYGSGILSSGVLAVTCSTISDNTAGTYGAVYLNTSSSDASFTNSIIAANIAGIEKPDICNSHGMLFGSNNLIGDGAGQTALVDGENNNLVGTSNAPLDPLFHRNPSDGDDGWGDDPDTPDVDESANDDYGDLHLRVDSPGVDAGDNSLLPADEFDLDNDGDTAELLPVDLDGNPRIVNGSVDIGAYEGKCVTRFIVSTLVDENDGDYSIRDLSLREALALAADEVSYPGTDEITFDASLFADGPATITLDGTELTLDSDVTIDGPGAELLAIDADGRSRVFGVSESITATIDGLTITGGLAEEGGGIYNNGTLTVIGSTLSGNSAPGERGYGGGIYSALNSVLSVTGCTFSGNLGGGGGGICSHGALTVTDSTFSENSAHCGGGIDNYGTLTISDSAFFGNSVGNEGGGVRNSGMLTVTNSTFSGNSTRWGVGGGIRSDGELTVAGSTFSDNSAGDDGGGVHSSDGTLTVTDCTLSNNSAEGEGGAICNYTGTLTVTDCTLSDNSTETHGGGIYNNGTLTVTGSTLSGNSAKWWGGGIGYVGTLTISDSTLSGNLAVRGGGVHSSDGTLTVTDCTLSDNLAEEYGGGIYNNVELTVTGSTLSGNWAEEYGGGIYINGELIVTACTLLSNSAKSSGGGIYGDRHSTLTVTDCELSGNMAEVYGGGIYQHTGTLTVTNSTLVGNSAGDDGGGIYGDEYSTLTVSGCSLSGNMAVGDGGGIHRHHYGGTLTVIDCTFSGNSAVGDGGAICNSGILTVTSTTLSGNLAGNDGGGIYHYTGTLMVTNSIVALNDASSAPDIYGVLDSGSGLFIGIDPSFVRNPSDGGDGWGDDPDTPDVDESANDDYGDLRLTAYSPAIDAGDNALLPADTLDLDNDGDTSEPLPYDLDGNPRVYGTSVDCGAFELQSGIAAGREVPSVIVTTAEDVFDIYDQQISLREAIWYANSATVGTTITFADALDGSTITLQGTPLWIDKSLAIDASAFIALTIDAAGHSRVLDVVAAKGEEVELAGLTITGGSAEEGAGIRNHGTLILTDSTLTANSATGERGSGGGIYNYGTLTVIGSAFSGNSATGESGSGGGIYNGGTLTVTSSTLSGNLAKYGGGIGNGGTLTLTDCTLVDNSTENSGGGIGNGGTLTVIGSTLSDNSAGNDGGGIDDYSGTLTMTSCMLSGNSAGNDGGGIHSRYSTLTVSNSTLSGNSAGNDGGGIHVYNGTLAISGSTLSGNSAAKNGGGVFDWSSTLTISGSTLAGNLAESDGGGVYNWSSTATVACSTISGNAAVSRGGGIHSDSYSTLTATNSIVALNEASLNADISGAPGSGSGFNLIGVDPSFVRNPSDGGDGWGDDPDTPDVDESDNDDYGDLHLRVDSPGVDAGDNSLLPADEFDLDNDGDTAELLPVDFDGNPRIINGSVDIGAYERKCVTELIVSTLVDENDGDYSVGDLSLREALALAADEANYPGADEITFDATLFTDGPATITLDGTELTLDSDVTIDGPGVNLLAIDADGQSRVFSVSESVTVTIDGLTITGGSANAGGGIRNLGVLTIDGSTISNNTAIGTWREGGGGIYNLGELTIVDSLLCENSAPNKGYGGGIYNAATVTISNSTLSANWAIGQTDGDSGGSGGAIYNDEDCVLTVTNSTLVGNWTSGMFANGAGVGNFRGTVTIVNSILAGNTANGDWSRGAALYTQQGDAALVNSTIAGNSADGEYSSNAGVYNRNGSLVLQNSIVALNTAASDPDVGGSWEGNGIVGTDPLFSRNPSDGGDGWADDPDTPNVDESANDDYGDLHLRLDSPGVDAGDNSLLPADAYDLDNDGDTTEALPVDIAGEERVIGIVVDMGAYEGESVGQLVVSTLVDENDGDYSAGDLSLREAMLLAASCKSNEIITFDSALFDGGAQTISLDPTLGELEYDVAARGVLEIDGPGAERLSIDAQGACRVFHFTGSTVVLRGLTISGGLVDAANGRMEEMGGGILVDRSANVHILDATIRGNTAYCGGALAGYLHSSLTLTNTVIVGNVGDYGGGIYLWASPVTLTNVTIAGNDGEPIYAAEYEYFCRKITLNNAIVANNGGSIYGDVVGLNNLFKDPLFVRNPSDGGDGWGDDPDTLDVDESANDDYGDLHLRLDSPAVDAGDNSLLPADEFDLDNDGDATEPLPVDLDGNPRVVNGSVDIGAYERKLVAELVVSTLVDENDGDYSDGDLSLREAMALAATYAYDQVITFSPDLFVDGSRTIVLDATLGQLEYDAKNSSVDGKVTIEGPGADLLTIDAAGNSRVFAFIGSEAKLEGLTITGGVASGWGGGVYADNGATVEIVACTIAKNSTSGSGGGIRAANGTTLVLTDAVISDNHSGTGGGGISVFETTCTMTNTVITGNTGSNGGGVYALYSAVTLTNATVVDNTAENGGGVYGSGVSLDLINSTVAGNSAEATGGGIYSNGQSFTVTNSTIAHNVANDGGGIYVKAASSTATLNNTIVARNTSHDAGPNIRGELSGANNLIGDGTGQTSLVDGVDGNMVGTAESPIDPLLSDITQFDNGHWGYLLLSESPAIDAGDNALAVDEQGHALADDLAGNPRIENGIVDIGAVEGVATLTEGQIYIVTSLANVIDANDGQLTFIEAFQAANSNRVVGDAPAGSCSELDTIRFADGLAGTVAVDGGQLAIAGKLSIEGPGADMLTFDAQGENRVFYVQSGAEVALSGMTITGGQADDGGGIYSNGTLAIARTTMSDNVAANNGGGVYNRFGVLTVTDCTLSGNVAGADGGAIHDDFGMTAVANSLIAANSAGGSGGGIFATGTVTVGSSTIACNSAENDGGGIYSNSILSIFNSIVALNRADNGANVSGTLTSTSQFNLTDVDPQFVSAASAGEDGIWHTDDDVAGDYRLSIDSPAIDAGSNALAVDADGNPLLWDIRGEGFDRVVNWLVDIGAYENQDVVVTEYYFVGTDGDDTFEFTAGATAADWVVKVNGVEQIFPDTVEQIFFDGLDGNDQVTLIGTAGADTAVLEATAAELSGSGYAVFATNVENSTVYGRAGEDTITFYDNAGRNQFVAGRGFAGYLTGFAGELRSYEFEQVTAYAGDGIDEAKLYDSAGDDVFVSDPDVSVLTGGGMTITVHDFQGVHAYATLGGVDKAYFTDTALDDQVIGTHEYAIMWSPNYEQGVFNRSKFFEESYAVSSHGGADIVKFYDGPGDDAFVADEHEASFTCVNKYTTSSVFVEDFVGVHAFASTGTGYDTATFYDSTGNDEYYSDAVQAALWNTTAGWYNRAKFFERTDAYATAGGTDKATLVDSTFDDNLLLDANSLTIYGADNGHHFGTSFRNRIELFDTVYAKSIGGTDVLELEDSNGADTLEATGHQLSFFSAEHNLDYVLEDIAQTTAKTDDNNTDTRKVLDYLFDIDFEGRWRNAL